LVAPRALEGASPERVPSLAGNIDGVTRPAKVYRPAVEISAW
jgi:hypothetical protein